METRILNCPLEYECPKTWQSLFPTQDTNIKHCDTCDQNVHLLDGIEGISNAAAKGWCVAVDVEYEAEAMFFLQPSVVRALSNEKSNNAKTITITKRLLGIPRRSNLDKDGDSD